MKLHRYTEFIIKESITYKKIWTMKIKKSNENI